MQETLAQIPWYHHIALLEKLDDPAKRLWYARQAMEHGWSHSILVLQINGRAHARQGKAITNFRDTLPPAESDLATQVFKDPYLFDFVGTADPRRERKIEQSLVDHIQRFLLELGAGFAFVGRQVPLEVGDQDFQAAASPTPDRSRRMGDDARRETPEGPERQPAHSEGDRGGGLW